MPTSEPRTAVSGWPDPVERHASAFPNPGPDPFLLLRNTHRHHAGHRCPRNEIRDPTVREVRTRTYTTVPRTPRVRPAQVLCPTRGPTRSYWEERESHDEIRDPTVREVRTRTHTTVPRTPRVRPARVLCPTRGRHRRPHDEVRDPTVREVRTRTPTTVPRTPRVRPAQVLCPTRGLTRSYWKNAGSPVGR
jgi:hypothetical protein